MWYGRAQVDYLQSYMSIYAAFNVWYGQLFRTNNDRYALTRLQKGLALWQAYEEGNKLGELTRIMRQIVEYTQREPLSTITPHWNGEVRNIYDWPSLIEYWYRVRCLVMHGSYIEPTYVLLAYESLNIFMSELIPSLEANTVYNSFKTSYN